MSNDHPPAYGLVTSVYRSSLRPIILPLALFTGIWSLVWAIGLFKEIGTDNSQHEKKLATFAIALGAMYSAVAVIEFFGTAAAGFQRYALIRIYSFLSVAAAILVIGAGLLRVIVHFMLKNDLITECTQLATNQTVDFRWGIWGPHIDHTLTASEAASWCKDAWNHDSLSEIVSLIVTIVFAALITLLAFSYAHQTSGDTAPTRLAGPAPAAYHPPYEGTSSSIPDLSYNAPYAPPAGPPPGFREMDDDDGDIGKPPGYGAGAGVAVQDKKVYDVDVESGKGDDPFADFESAPRHH
ncbi:hypothetical protein FA95DRAFT_713098 [Auriscalpium vulgare]|uniref:Uncharacterized protein n=1 Tax=Auriscalpium vulgare TaxID=40419 RepID=A0ACB8RC60_9AGAM|nr:hypothetical protein FA95DRAFT_713098 [Auriscalpium vulgare]